LSLALFEKTPLDQLLNNSDTQTFMPQECNQLNLFD